MTTNAMAPPAAVPAEARWPKNRILFLLAGSGTVLGTALAASVSKWFLLIPAAVGANQLLMVGTGWCPVSGLLDKVLPPAE